RRSPGPPELYLKSRAQTNDVSQGSSTVIAPASARNHGQRDLFRWITSPAVLQSTIPIMDWALFALVFVIYTNLSELGIGRYGAPSILKVLISIVLLLLLFRWVVRGESPGGSRESIALLAATGIVIAVSLLYADYPELSAIKLIAYVKNAGL